MIGVLQLFGVGLLVAWLGVVLYTAWSLGRVPRYTYGSAVARGRPGDPGELDRPTSYESFVVDGCACWSIEGDDPSGVVVVMVHGWSRSRIAALVRFEALRGVVSRVVAIDLPGHGESEGRCELGAGEWRVVRRVIEVVVADAGSPVLLHGWSMGAGVALEAAGRVDAGMVLGVVAEAPYAMPMTPARNVMQGMGVPWRLTLRPALFLCGLTRAKGPFWRGFDRRVLAERVDVPLLVVHGDADEICPVSDGRAIAAAAPRGELVEIEGGTHDGLWIDEESRERMASALRGFLRTIAP
ncbi:MAG: alpha/beta fold hydrolase [Planctomycetota bacterium]